MFNEDLKEGVGKEHELAYELMRKSSDFKKLISGKNKDRDIAIENEDGITTYEVKYDRQYPDTGNIAIEYRYKGKPSGIYTSKADKIAYYIGDTFKIQDRGELIIRVDELLRRGIAKAIMGGDDNQASMYLIPKQYVDRLFTTPNYITGTKQNA